MNTNQDIYNIEQDIISLIDIVFKMHSAISNHVISTKNEYITSPFRPPTRPTHDGIDMVDADRLEKTQDVYIMAIADGMVTDTIVGTSIGHSVSVLHKNKTTPPPANLLTRYFHMKPNSVRVKEGQAVKKGDILGIMGTSGDSTGIHLHFAVKENSTAWNNGIYVDPMPYLTGGKNIDTGNNGGNLTSQEYDELKKEIDALKSVLDKWTDNSRIKYGWVDENMPEWARATITKLTYRGYLNGNEHGNLRLSDDMLRTFVVLDRAGVFDK